MFLNRAALKATASSSAVQTCAPVSVINRSLQTTWAEINASYDAHRAAAPGYISPQQQMGSDEATCVLQTVSGWILFRYKVGALKLSGKKKAPEICRSLS